MSDSIHDVHDYWERFARYDPLWAILSDPGKRNRRWDPDLFFRTGRHEISTLMYQLERRHIPVSGGKAMDFGCGVGRATQALAAYFGSVIGIDIAETMIRLAEKFNRFPGRVRYVRNRTDDLKAFAGDEFDFIYSNIVLQHLAPAVTLRYLTEFIRVLRPGGLLVFQLPSQRRSPAAGNPMTPAPMADDAYRAEIAIQELAAGPVGPATELLLGVNIRNRSRHDWDRSRCGPIRVGNHWLTNDGSTMLIQDDGRSPLPDVVPAAGGCSLLLRITTPSRSGDYLCEIDLVHEGISWFRDKGSPSVRLPFRIGARTDPGPPAGPGQAGEEAAPAMCSAREFYAQLSAEAADPGPFPMHGIRRDQISEHLRARGARIMSLEEDGHGGPEWIGYRYIVRKN